MSTFGFVEDSVELAMDRHFAYLIAAKHSQGELLYPTPSFEYLIYQYDGDAEALCEGMRNLLKQHFKELFDIVEVEAFYAGIDNERDAKIKITIAVTVVISDAIYDLGRAITVSGKTFELINEGHTNAAKRNQ